MVDDNFKFSFRALVKGDLQKHIESDRFSWLSVISCFRHPPFFSVFIYRLSSACVRKGFLGKLAAGFLLNLNYLFHSCEIDPRADIGPGFQMVHPMGVVIGAIKAGANVVVLQNVTIGGKNKSYAGEPVGEPTLGSQIFLSAGAVVLAPVTIGSHVNVGANAVVETDIPDYSTAVGVPARIIKKTPPQTT